MKNPPLSRGFCGGSGTAEEVIDDAFDLTVFM